MSNNAVSRSPVRAATLLLATLVLTGCGTRFIDARNIPGGCAFGGATPDEELACAERSFGLAGALLAVNRQAKESVRGRENSCKDHVVAVARLRPATQGLYTTVDGVHHVSALVEGHVLDNGALGIPGDLMALEEFRAWYGTGFEIAGLPDRNPEWNVAQLRQLAAGRR